MCDERRCQREEPGCQSPPPPLDHSTSLWPQPPPAAWQAEPPWVRITPSQSYFIRRVLTVLLIPLFRTQRHPPTPPPPPPPPSFLLFHTSFSPVLPPLCPHRQIGFLHLASSTTTAIFNSSRSPSKENNPTHTHPTLHQSPTPHPCLCGGVGRGGGGG